MKVEQRVKADKLGGRLGTLLRDDQKRQAQEKLETMLLEGLQSAASEMMPEDWQDIRDEVRLRHAARARETG